MEDKKYVFISYAHKDADKVLPVLRMLEENGVRFWFDAGIEAGADWPKTVAGRLRASGCVAVFTSGNFARSQNCTRELNFAVAEKKPLIRIDLDGKTLPEDIAMQLSGAPDIPYTGAAPAAKRMAELLSDGFPLPLQARCQDLVQFLLAVDRCEFCHIGSSSHLTRWYRSVFISVCLDVNSCFAAV